jgi:hypothetical protein
MQTLQLDRFDQNILHTAYSYSTFGTMADQGQTPQNTTRKYLTKDRLQARLESLFPGQTEFNIRVRNILMEFSLRSEQG